jgi:hypothetical protein
MVEVAAEKNSTLVLPFPVELLRYFEEALGRDAIELIGDGILMDMRRRPARSHLVASALLAVLTLVWQTWSRADRSDGGSGARADHVLISVTDQLHGA